MPTVPHDLFRRFFERVEQPSDAEACWRWTGYTDQDGYGMLWVKIGDSRPRNHRASRLSYLIHTGDIPDGLLACHTCDNPICVNPRHLFLGTPKENSRDRDRKGRSASLRGELAPMAKLTAAQVAEIRALLNEGVSSTEIARRFGVKQPTISNIKTGKRWVETDAVMGRPASVTQEQAREIRILRSQGVSTKMLAEQFGVAPITINRAVRGVLWPDN